MVPIALNPAKTYTIEREDWPAFRCKFLTARETDDFVESIAEWQGAADDADGEARMWRTFAIALRGWDLPQPLTCTADLLAVLTNTQVAELPGLILESQRLTENHRKNSVSPDSSDAGSSAAPAVAAIA